MQSQNNTPQQTVNAVTPEKPVVASQKIIAQKNPQPTAATVTTPTAPEAISRVLGQMYLDISAIGISIPLGTTGLDSAGHLMVPANPNRAAWYSAGPAPGNAGTALITGHLDSAAGPGVFYNLRKLTAGQQINVTKTDGSIAVFRIDKLVSYPQDSTFPWNLVYSTSGSPALRIITCDGVYSPQTGHYSRNLVVYASLVN
ncbi:MAG TPA: class F sortase [Patescibacteria group bacterium]|nr:class F sortase [Patescibacteria group bacterium]